MEFTKEELEYLLSCVKNGKRENWHWLENLKYMSDDGTKIFRELKKSTNDKERLLDDLLRKMIKGLEED